MHNINILSAWLQIFKCGVRPVTIVHHNYPNEYLHQDNQCVYISGVKYLHVEHQKQIFTRTITILICYVLNNNFAQHFNINNTYITEL